MTKTMLDPYDDYEEKSPTTLVSWLESMNAAALKFDTAKERMNELAEADGLTEQTAMLLYAEMEDAIYDMYDTVDQLLFLYLTKGKDEFAYKFWRELVDNAIKDRVAYLSSPWHVGKKLYRKSKDRREYLFKKIFKDLKKDVADDFVRKSPLQRWREHAYSSLTPEQKLVFEHTIEGYGKPVVLDDEGLAQKIGMTPEKVREIKKQIFNILTLIRKESNE